MVFEQGDRKLHFDKGVLEADITEKDPIRALLQAALRKIKAEVEVRCEDRTFDELDNECPSSREVCEEVEKSCQSSDNPFRPFMMQLLLQLLTCLDLNSTSWSLFLTVRCALYHGPQLLNRLGFALSPLLPVIN